jgi:aminoglycoside phosphotransferase family enzyme/predicted kinase
VSERSASDDDADRDARGGLSAEELSALPDYVRGLLDPAAYPLRPERVELVQTHISYVFLAGEVVYKTKKPVDFGFIDQVAPERREAYCHAEVELNRRLAPDVYLGVVPVVRRTDGAFEVEGDASAGEVVEWAVKMRRLPDDRTLDQLLARNQEPIDLLEHLTERLVRFHAEAEVVADDREFAGLPAERAWWEREYSEAAPFIGDTWDPEHEARMRGFVEHMLEAQGALFDERLAAGRVVDGHGDLQAKHVYVLGNRPQDLLIVDCIEFTDWFHFRYVDVGYDLAFLAMDLEAQGRADLGDELCGRYIAAAADETLGLLQPLHRAFRAFVRGKVESMGARAPEVPAELSTSLEASARRYFALAADYPRRVVAPSLVVMTGVSGTGKSLIAATFAGRAGAAFVSSDIVRKELAGLDPHQPAGDSLRQGLYSTEMSARTYEEMRRRAAAHLAAGRPVVLDATHSRAIDRGAAARVALDAGVPFLIVEMRLSDDAALTRIQRRMRDPYRTSDATPEVFREQVRRFDPVTSAEGASLALDASISAADLAAEIADALPSAGG